MPEAARVGDCHGCLALGPLPHVGGPVQPPCSPNVTTNARHQARTGDRCTCLLAGAPDFIVTGSATVTINGLPAAREGDRAMHARGLILTGSPNVLIGGPTVGGTIGNPKAGLKACRAARSGRNPPAGALDPAGNQIQPNTPGQSYNNCGVESARQIINRTHPDNPISQEDLLNQSMNNGTANGTPNNLFASGGTGPEGRVQILEDNNVPAHLESNSLQNLAQSVGEGKGVIAAVMAGTLWPVSSPNSNAPPPGTGGHAILVTGIEYDKNGNIKNVIINDTGTGQCMVSVPAATFEQALKDRGGDHVVTDNPIW